MMYITVFEKYMNSTKTRWKHFILRSYCNKELNMHGLSYRKITSNQQSTSEKNVLKPQSRIKGVLFNIDSDKIKLKTFSCVANQSN
jgi:hypothetical protein